jgi:cobalamin biosynthesis Mg chelatase CobN
MAQREAGDGTAHRRHIDAAMSAAQRAKSLVERILAFSRSGVGDRVPVHVQSVVEEALQVVAASMPAGVHLTQHLETGDAAVMGDATQIHQVVTNLCSNAVQAMRAAGALTVALDDRRDAEPHVATTSTLAPGRYVRSRSTTPASASRRACSSASSTPSSRPREIGVGTAGPVAGARHRDRPGRRHRRAERGGPRHDADGLLPWQCTSAASTPRGPRAAGDGETVLLVGRRGDLVRLCEEMMPSSATSRSASRRARLRWRAACHAAALFQRACPTSRCPS